MNHSYLTAIIVCEINNQKQGLKYHDIPNNEGKIRHFLAFAHKKPSARYVNFYFKADHESEKKKNFAFRRYLDNS